MPESMFFCISFLYSYSTGTSLAAVSWAPWGSSVHNFVKIFFRALGGGSGVEMTLDSCGERVSGNLGSGKSAVARLLTPKTREVLIAFRISAVKIFSDLLMAYRMPENIFKKMCTEQPQGAQLTTASELPVCGEIQHRCGGYLLPLRTAESIPDKWTGL